MLKPTKTMYARARRELARNPEKGRRLAMFVMTEVGRMKFGEEILHVG